jgi:alpha-tubulin suppressor-like RCC1 family protein
MRRTTPAPVLLAHFALLSVLALACRNGREHAIRDGGIDVEAGSNETSGGGGGSNDAAPPDGVVIQTGVDAPPSGDRPSGSDAPPSGSKLANGNRCNAASDCISGFCVDTVCCESSCSGQCEACGERSTEGRCVAVQGTPRQPRVACGGQVGACAGRCDGSNRMSCSFPGAEQECASADCKNGVAVTRSVCDRAGGCPPQTMVSCAPSTCQGTICANGCSTQSPCPSDSFCAAGKCLPRKDAGGSCALSEECKTGSCVDGHCCTTSTCGQCRACVGAGGTCAPVTNADDLDSCIGTCDASGVCKSKQGQPCGGGCVAGTTCSPDGYCCDQACTGPCMACDLPGALGKCSPVPSGNPHAGKSCGSGECAGTCSGRTDGQCSYPSPAPNCGTGPSCAGNSFVGQSTCQNGSCLAPPAQTCSNGCSATGCKSNCVTTADCDYPQVCSDSKCVKVTQISCEYYGTCALLADGTVRCWGDNMYGQLGTGSLTPDRSSSPLRVTGLSGAKAIASGNHHSCALLTNGTVMCWGSNVAGAIGQDPAVTTVSSTPLPVAGLANGAALSASTGGLTNCALITGGSIKCWGAGGSGQLGDGSMPAGGSFMPVTVSGISNATAVVVGYQQTFALLPGGAVKGWGSNNSGQLATDAPAQTSSPIDMTVGGSSAALGAGGGHTCAVLGDGSVRCFGNDDSGQLGDGTTRPGGGTPVTVMSLPPAKAVTGYPSATCALLNDGTVRCWGSAPLGDGNSSSTAPVAVTGLSGVSSLCTGGSHTCALLSTGQVRCWGYNQKGQLGDGSIAFRATPVAVTGW